MQNRSRRICAGTQRPWRANQIHLPVFWIPAIPAGMTAVSTALGLGGLPPVALRIWSNIISRKMPNVGRNKTAPAGVSGKDTPTKSVGVKPETPVNGLIPAYCASKLFSTLSLTCLHMPRKASLALPQHFLFAPTCILYVASSNWKPGRDFSAGRGWTAARRKPSRGTIVGFAP